MNNPKSISRIKKSLMLSLGLGILNASAAFSAGIDAPIVDLPYSHHSVTVLRGVPHPEAAAMRVAAAAAARADDGTKYDTATVSNGYANVTQAGVIIHGAPGGTVSANVNIDMQVSTVTDDTVKEWFDKLVQTSSGEYADRLREVRTHVGGSAGFFWSVFGVSGGASYDSYDRTHTVNYKKEDNKIQEGFLKSLHTLHNSNTRLTGNFLLTSYTPVPIEACLYLKTVRLMLSDGSHLTFVDTSSPTVATPQGKPIAPGALTAVGELKLIPLA